MYILVYVSVREGVCVLVVYVCLVNIVYVWSFLACSELNRANFYAIFSSPAVVCNVTL